MKDDDDVRFESCQDKSSEAKQALATIDKAAKAGDPSRCDSIDHGVAYSKGCQRILDGDFESCVASFNHVMSNASRFCAENMLVAGEVDRALLESPHASYEDCTERGLDCELAVSKKRYFDAVEERNGSACPTIPHSHYRSDCEKRITYMKKYFSDDIDTCVRRFKERASSMSRRENTPFRLGCAMGIGILRNSTSPCENLTSHTSTCEQEVRRSQDDFRIPSNYYRLDYRISRELPYDEPNAEWVDERHVTAGAIAKYIDEEQASGDAPPGVSENTVSDGTEVNQGGPVLSERRLVSFWCGAVNQHTEDGEWKTDPDGESGCPSQNYPANPDTKLEYCKKWWPDTVRVEKAGEETITDWRGAGNTGSKTATKMTYHCVPSDSPN